MLILNTEITNYIRKITEIPKRTFTIVIIIMVFRATVMPESMGHWIVAKVYGLVNW